MAALKFKIDSAHIWRVCRRNERFSAGGEETEREENEQKVHKFLQVKMNIIPEYLDLEQTLEQADTQVPLESD